MTEIYYLSKKAGYLVILICLISMSVLHAQVPNLRFQHYSVEQGLAQSSVFCILQDQKGFMWFGTEQGLNRFDGYNFVVHKFQPDNPNSLSNSFVLSIHEDSSGILWIGTNGGGLNKLDPETMQFSRYLVTPQNLGSPDNIINVIFEDRSGVLWLGTGGGGFKKFDRDKKTITHCPVKCMESNPLCSNTINALWEDNNGNLWVGTDEGLKKLDMQTMQISATTLPAKKILTLYEDESGKLWVGTDSGFYEFEPGTGRFVHYRLPTNDDDLYRSNTVNVIYEDRLNTFWIGTKYGLYIFDRREKKYHWYFADRDQPHSLSSNRISSIYEDRSGALWVGVNAGALNKLNRTGQSFLHYYNSPKNFQGLGNRNVFAIYEDQEEILWLGTFDEGLNAFNRKTGKFTNYRNRPGDPHSLSNNIIWAICGDRRGDLWIGTNGGGINQFSPRTGKFIRFQHQPQNPGSLGNDTVSIIIEDRKGSLWIGTAGGLDKLDPKRKQFVHYRSDPKNPNTPAHNFIYVIHEDRRGKLWMGTRDGLSIFETDSETFTTYLRAPGDTGSGIHYSIFSICEDREGVMWLGTTGGLYKINPKDHTHAVYTEKDGLPNDVINGVLNDDRGNLWLSTNNGLSKFNPRTGKFKNYSAADGLQSYEFNGGAYYKNRRGELFFGGINGFNAFFPDAIKDNPYVPPVMITDFKIFNQPVPIGKKLKGHVVLEKAVTEAESITLTRKHNTFSFEFAALNYIHSEKNEYAYMMEGLDETWNYVRWRRFVTYANLSRGDYTFRVKASNNHSVWNDEGVSLEIKVLPPFWLTWWFRISIILLAVILVFAVFKVRTRLIMNKIRQEERLKTAKLESIRILAGGIAHDFNNLLAIMQGNLELALSDTRPDQDIHDVLKEAGKSVTKAADLVRQFITLSKGNIPVKETKFIQGIIRDAVEPILQGSDVKCDFRLAENLRAVDCDALQLKQAIENIVINAVQAMPEGGVVEVAAKNEILAAGQVPGKAPGCYVCISIKDNGTGIPGQDLPRIFDPYFSTRLDVTQKGLGLGLSVVQAIITKHDGTIHVTSEVDVGTVARICLPASPPAPPAK